MTTASETSARAEKIHKVLANLGLGSRRKVESWIRQGKIRVDGSPAAIGMRVSESQSICVAGRLVDRSSVRRRVLLYHKPRGEEVSMSPGDGRRTVFCALPAPGSGKWMNVGRLDVDTEGLLLFSNDGEYIHLITHPSAQVERRYCARVNGKLAPDEIREIRDGLANVGSRPLRWCRISLMKEPSGRNAWYKVTLREGRNRVVRKLFEAYGLRVSRLIRTGFGSVDLPRDLKQGCWSELDPAAADRLGDASSRARIRMPHGNR